jgi:hypothetical protein
VRELSTKLQANWEQSFIATVQNADGGMVPHFEAAAQFKWIKGEELLSRYHSSEFVVKHFCSVCGSNLISTYDNDPTKIGVPLGGLEQAPTNAPEGHIFVGSKSPWFNITDGLPQYELWPGSHAKVRETKGDT